MKRRKMGNEEKILSRFMFVKKSLFPSQKKKDETTLLVKLDEDSFFAGFLFLFPKEIFNLSDNSVQKKRKK